MGPIFVRGLSRSGGTLMATILDAHPEIAMGYELYEHLLKPFDLSGKSMSDLAGIFNGFGGSSALKTDPAAKGFLKFAARAERSGVSKQTLIRLLKIHAERGNDFNDASSRLLFVERVVKEKARLERKRIWGAKISSNYMEIESAFTEASYLFMLRDGRDIAASRKKVGDFKQSVAEIAQAWKKQIAKFEEFAARSRGRAIFVPYEKMALEPERELRALLDKLNLPWSDRILSFHALNLSIHRNATGHLSGKQVKRPISTTSIGRWKDDLTREEVSQFEESAGEVLVKLGYL
ncbi:sulfotransferase [Luminiphilus sp.]|nr:sulfotransferase [Luminiphilus sp.]